MTPLPAASLTACLAWSLRSLCPKLRRGGSQGKLFGELRSKREQVKRVACGPVQVLRPEVQCLGSRQGVLCGCFLKLQRLLRVPYTCYWRGIAHHTQVRRTGFARDPAQKNHKNPATVTPVRRLTPSLKRSSKPRDGLVRPYSRTVEGVPSSMSWIKRRMLCRVQSMRVAEPGDALAASPPRVNSPLDENTLRTESDPAR